MERRKLRDAKNQQRNKTTHEKVLEVSSSSWWFLFSLALFSLSRLKHDHYLPGERFSFAWENSIPKTTPAHSHTNTAENPIDGRWWRAAFAEQSPKWQRICGRPPLTFIQLAPCPPAPRPNRKNPLHRSFSAGGFSLYFFFLSHKPSEHSTPALSSRVPPQIAPSAGRRLVEHDSTGRERWKSSWVGENIGEIIIKICTTHFSFCQSGKTKRRTAGDGDTGLPDKQPV